MIIFKQKKIITTKSLGEDLRKARKAFNLSILAVEKKIGIASKYLEALENNEYEIIPGEVYARNFLKKYVKFLNLNWQKSKEKYNRELISQKVWEGGIQKRFGLARKKFIILPKILKNVFISFLISIIILYLGWQLWSLLSSPKLEILYPKEDSVFSNNFVKILGRADKESKLMLNDQEISIANDGFFLVDINLNKGLNIIKIEAKKRYGKNKILYWRIIVR